MFCVSAVQGPVSTQTVTRRGVNDRQVAAWVNTSSLRRETPWHRKYLGMKKNISCSSKLWLNLTLTYFKIKNIFFIRAVAMFRDQRWLTLTWWSIMNLDVSHRTQLIRIGWSHLYKVVTSELKRVSRSLLSRVTCHVSRVGQLGGSELLRRRGEVSGEAITPQPQQSHSTTARLQQHHRSSTPVNCSRATRELPAAGLSRWSAPVNQGYWTWDGSWILNI